MVRFGLDQTIGWDSNQKMESNEKEEEKEEKETILLQKIVNEMCF